MLFRSMANVIQSMVLTDGSRMVLTPSYYVYKLYLPFQDARLIPVTLDAGQYNFEGVTLPQVDGIAARGKDGRIYVALTNLDPNRDTILRVTVPGFAAKSARGQTLTAARVDSVNTFDAPDTVVPRPFSARTMRGALELKLPSKSVTVVELGQ